MSYDTRKAELGRQPVYIVEIDLDYCDHTYGTAPCVAAVGVTGLAKCFNTRKTCQDFGNYLAAPKTYRFSNVILPASSDLDFIAIPCISGITMAPTVIDPLNGIGKRASVVVTLKDFTLSDFGIDKYDAERPYDSGTRGTFWTKLLARNPYYQNRVMRVKVGYLVDGEAPDAANFETRVYLLQLIDGPDRSGVIRLTAQDPLKLLDDARAKAPLANTGTLLATISPVDVSATLLPAGIGDAEYPASGVLVLGDELAQFTRVGDVVTFITRGDHFSAAAVHQAGDAVQAALSYSGVGITAILYDMLVTRAGIPASYIDLAAWDAEVDTWLIDYSVATVIAKPVGLNQLVGELAQQCLFYIWWDERAHLIRLKAIRPLHNESSTDLDDDNNIIADTQSVTERPSDRRSQVWVCYGQKNPTVDLAKPYNFTNIEVVVDPAAESADEYDDSRIMIVYARWLPTGSGDEAEKLGRRLLHRYRDNPKTYKFKLDAKDSSLWTGDVVTATIRSVVDETGAKLPTAMQVLEVNETVPGSEYEYTLQDTQFKGRYAFWAPDAEPDYLVAGDRDRDRYAFWASDAGLMSDSADGYQYV